MVGESAPFDRDAWVERGRALVSAGERRHWDLAAWVAEGQTALGGSSVRETVKVLGIPRTTFRRYLAISTSSAVGRYRPTLGFSVCAEVAHLPEDEAARILGAAETGNWTVQQVREAVREASAAGKLRRAREEIARLRDENTRLRIDHATALAEARRTETRVKTALQAAETAWREIAESIDALALGAGRSLHGNASPAVRRRIEDLLRRFSGRIDRLVNERIVPALDKISPAKPE